MQNKPSTDSSIDRILAIAAYKMPQEKLPVDPHLVDLLEEAASAFNVMKKGGYPKTLPHAFGIDSEPATPETIYAGVRREITIKLTDARRYAKALRALEPYKDEATSLIDAGAKDMRTLYDHQEHVSSMLDTLAIRRFFISDDTRPPGEKLNDLLQFYKNFHNDNPWKNNHFMNWEKLADDLKNPGLDSNAVAKDLFATMDTKLAALEEHLNKKAAPHALMHSEDNDALRFVTLMYFYMKEHYPAYGQARDISLDGIFQQQAEALREWHNVPENVRDGFMTPVMNEKPEDHYIPNYSLPWGHGNKTIRLSLNQSADDVLDKAREDIHALPEYAQIYPNSCCGALDQSPNKGIFDEVNKRLPGLVEEVLQEMSEDPLKRLPEPKVSDPFESRVRQSREKVKTRRQGS